MHNMPLRPGQWWACAEPERPGDSDTCWDPDCPVCRIKLAIEIQQTGDFPLQLQDVDGVRCGFARASSILERYGDDTGEGGEGDV